ncbi:DUF3244 domain-containing protein, partial [Bacteroides sp. OttesenSCG-928-N06]|nr:DUF3244 domain-containing protein [Bacteroides sp. OttesenSCG-928-N06]
MNTLSIFVCVLLTSIVQLAESEKQIKTDIVKWKGKHRTLPIPPVLAHVDNTVFLYSDLPLENMEVTVTDASGQIVYMDILTVGAGETISFTFDVSMESEYLIEIRHAGKYLCGWFE